MMEVYAATVLVTIICILGKVEPHGRMIDPPSRASMWRFGFDVPQSDYDDNQGYCGGQTQLWSRFNGACGVCGDPWGPAPRAHERGGRYYAGTPTREYNEGDIIEVTSDITANHRGWFEFRLCPYDDPEDEDVEWDDEGNFREVSHTCLDKHILQTEDGETRWYLPEPFRVGTYTVRVRLPWGLHCKNCLLQWKWNVANSWGQDPDGTSCIGCGKQEQFFACSDIIINPSDGSEPWHPPELPEEPSYPDTTDTPIYPVHPLEPPTSPSFPVDTPFLPPMHPLFPPIGHPQNPPLPQPPFLNPHPPFLPPGHPLFPSIPQPPLFPPLPHFPPEMFPSTPAPPKTTPKPFVFPDNEVPERVTWPPVVTTPRPEISTWPLRRHNVVPENRTTRPVNFWKWLNRNSPWITKVKATPAPAAKNLPAKVLPWWVRSPGSSLQAGLWKVFSRMNDSLIDKNDTRHRLVSKSRRSSTKTPTTIPTVKTTTPTTTTSSPATTRTTTTTSRTPPSTTTLLPGQTSETFPWWIYFGRRDRPFSHLPYWLGGDPDPTPYVPRKLRPPESAPNSKDTFPEFDPGKPINSPAAGGGPNDVFPLGRVCIPAGIWIERSDMWEWCKMNCAVGNCPPTHCICSDSQHK